MSRIEPLDFACGGILSGFCQRNAAARSVRPSSGDIKICMHRNIAYEGYPGKMKAIGYHPACQGAEKHEVLQREKHEGGYATCSHMIMRWNRQEPKRSSGSQVCCQAVAKRMAAKFAVVRAGRNSKVGIGTYTPLMGAWHRFPPIYIIQYIQYIQYIVTSMYGCNKITGGKVIYRIQVNFKTCMILKHNRSWWMPLNPELAMI